MELLSDPNVWIAFAMLTALEIVLGIDNIIFISILVGRLPPHLRDWAEFNVFLDTLIEAGAIETVREVWWDIRPHPGYGTVELRMCDSMPTLWEIAALAALVGSADDVGDQRVTGARRERDHGARDDLGEDLRRRRSELPCVPWSLWPLRRLQQL